MAWIVLVLAGVFEVVMALSLKLSNGFGRLAGAGALPRPDAPARARLAGRARHARRRAGRAVARDRRPARAGGGGHRRRAIVRRALPRGCACRARRGRLTCGRNRR
ncbi:SMR family transporter [Nonomuraea sp. NPDC003201]